MHVLRHRGHDPTPAVPVIGRLTSYRWVRLAQRLTSWGRDPGWTGLQWELGGPAPCAPEHLWIPNIRGGALHQADLPGTPSPLGIGISHNLQTTWHAQQEKIISSFYRQASEAPHGGAACPRPHARWRDLQDSYPGARDSAFFLF